MLAFATTVTADDSYDFDSCSECIFNIYEKYCLYSRCLLIRVCPLFPGKRVKLFFCSYHYNFNSYIFFYML